MDVVRKEYVFAVSAVLAMLWQPELLLVVRLVQRREDMGLRRILNERGVLLLLHLPKRTADEGDDGARDEEEEADACVAPIVREGEALAGATCASVVAVVRGGREDVVLGGGARVSHKALAEHRGLPDAVRVEEDQRRVPAPPKRAPARLTRPSLRTLP